MPDTMCLHEEAFSSMRILSLMAALGCASITFGLVVPNGYEGVDASGVFALTSSTTERRYQMAISATQLSSLVGQSITGLRYRLNGTATTGWPTVTTTFPYWDVFVGPAVTPALWTNTFSTNWLTSPTQVRAGSLEMTAGAFPFGVSPNAMGPNIMFDTPYAYAGGDLIVQMNYPGHTSANAGGSMDAVLASGGPGNGWGVDFRAIWSGTASSATGSNGNFIVIELLTGSGAPSIEGVVTLEDLVGPCTDPVSWKLYDGVTEVASGTTTLGAGGEYAIEPGVAAGSYTFAMTGRTHLTEAQEVALSGGVPARADFSLTNGDVDQDNEVGPGDFGNLALAFLSADGDPNWNALADLDCDGEVGPGDFGILANNFLQSGWTP